MCHPAIAFHKCRSCATANVRAESTDVAGGTVVEPATGAAAKATWGVLRPHLADAFRTVMEPKRIAVEATRNLDQELALDPQERRRIRVAIRRVVGSDAGRRLLTSAEPDATVSELGRQILVQLQRRQGESSPSRLEQLSRAAAGATQASYFRAVTTPIALNILKNTLVEVQRDARQSAGSRKQLLALNRAAALDELEEPTLPGELLDPPLQAVVQGFVELAPWHRRIRSDVMAVIDVSDVTHESSLQEAFAGVLQQNRTVEQLHASLAHALETRAVDHHRRWLASDPPPAEARSANEAYRRLRLEASRPSYQLALLLVGTWGSGKSETVRSVIQSALDRGFAIVSLDARDGDLAPSDALVTAFRSSLSSQIGNLDEALLWLDQEDVSCCVIIDDLETLCMRDGWEPAALAKIMARCSSSARLRWVLAAEECLVPALLQGQLGNHWRTYAVQPKGDSLALDYAGWIDLDTANALRALGLQILRRQGPSRWAAELDAIPWRLDMFAQEARAINNPLKAKASIEATPNADAAPILLTNDRAVQLFLWELASQRIAEGNSEVFNLSVAAVTRLLATRPFTFAGASVVAEIRRDAEPPEGATVVQQLNQMAAIGLLTQSRMHTPTTAVSEARFQPRWLAFWADRVARELTRADSGQDPLEAMAEWATADATAFESAVATSLALLMVEELGADGVDVLWNHSAVSRGVLINAALQLPPAAQSRIGAQLMGRDRKLPFDSTFGLMRFLAQSEHLDGSGEQLAQCLSPHFTSVGRQGLGDYLRFTANSLCSRSNGNSPEERTTLALAFVGCERAGLTIGRQCAELVFQTLTRGRDASEVDADVRLALSRVRDKSSNRLGGSSFNPNSRDEDPYWRALLHELAGALCEELGNDALRYFVKRRWFDGEDEGLSRDLAESQRRAANLTLGTWYRNSASEQERATFVKDIETLVIGRFPNLDNKTARRSAWYQMKHTTPTQKGVEPLDVEFLPAMEKLSNFPHIAELPRFRETLEATRRSARPRHFS